MKEDWDLAGVFRLIEDDVPWDDFDFNVRNIETALGLALEATWAEFLRWEEQDEFRDEFGVPAEVVAAMGPEEKLGYVGRLLHTLEVAYGRGENKGSPATLLRGLNELSRTGAAAAPPSLRLVRDAEDAGEA